MTVKNAKLQWVSIKRPNEMSGKYTADVYLDDIQTQNLISKIEKAWSEHKGTFKGKPQSLGYSMVTDENGEETGEVKFKMTQAPENGGYTFTVKCYDAKAKLLEGDKIPDIGNGTIANVEFEIYPYTFKTNKGVKLNLKAIQILDLVEFGDNCSFGEEEGFVAEESNPFEAERPAGL